jgi:phytoene dehydrogenase-like protein
MLSSCVILLTLYVCGTLAIISEYDFPASRVISRDVAIIGGGASGTYAAVRLREDYDTSVVVVEHEAHLGGHVNTYIVPGTNTTVEYGVESYMRYGPATDFFERFGVETVPFVSRELTVLNVDIDTGKPLRHYTPPDVDDVNEAFQRWLAIVEQYERFMEPGYWEFPNPNDIPADFLTPFGDFVARHNLQAAVPRILETSGEGIGGVSHVLTMYIMQYFGAAISRALVDSSFFVPVGSNSLLYEHAYNLLKEDVLLSTTVKQVERSSLGAKLVVGSATGEYLILAKRILYTAPPSLAANLRPFDLDKKEREVFETWTYKYSYVSLLEVPCLPENYSISYLSPAAVPRNHLAIKEWPYSMRLDSTGPPGTQLFRLVFGANHSIEPEEAKQIIAENVRKLINSSAFGASQVCNIVFKTFVNHHGISWRQTVEQLREGFVQKLYALQGHQATWYTGYLWSSPYSSNVWAYTETVLARLLQSLKAGCRSGDVQD